MSFAVYSIVIVEFDGHWDSVDGFCRLFYQSPHRLTVLTDQNIFKKIKEYEHNRNVTFIVKENNKRIKLFLDENRTLVQAADLLFINTIHIKFKEYTSLPAETLTVLRVHNSFKQFRPLSHISVPFGFFYWRKAVSYLVQECISNNHFYYLGKINSRMDYFTFLSDSITQYALTHHLVLPQRVMPTLPLIPWEEKKHEKASDRIEISIVGALERRKKDYHIVVEAFTALFKTNDRLTFPVRLNLLGRSKGKYGESIIRELKKIDHPLFSLRYFIDEAPVEEFDAVLRSTHIIISPNRVNNITQLYREIYGKTKYSASLGTIVQFHALGIFPDDFVFDTDVDSYLRKYSSSIQLQQILLELIRNPQHLLEEIEIQKDFLRKKYNKADLLAMLEQFIQEHKK